MIKNDAELRLARVEMMEWFANRGMSATDAVAVMTTTISHMLIDSPDPEAGFRALQQFFDELVQKFPPVKEGANRAPQFERSGYAKFERGQPQ